MVIIAIRFHVFLRIFIYYMFVCFACVFVSKPHPCDACRGPKKAQDPKELELQWAVSFICMLGTRPRSYARVDSTFNISPAPVSLIIIAQMIVVGQQVTVTQTLLPTLKLLKDEHAFISLDIKVFQFWFLGKQYENQLVAH